MAHGFAALAAADRTRLASAMAQPGVAPAVARALKASPIRDLLSLALDVAFGEGASSDDVISAAKIAAPTLVANVDEGGDAVTDSACGKALAVLAECGDAANRFCALARQKASIP